MRKGLTNKNIDNLKLCSFCINESFNSCMSFSVLFQFPGHRVNDQWFDYASKWLLQDHVKYTIWQYLAVFSKKNLDICELSHVSLLDSLMYDLSFSPLISSPMRLSSLIFIKLYMVSQMRRVVFTVLLTILAAGQGSTADNLHATEREQQYRRPHQNSLVQKPEQSDDISALTKAQVRQPGLTFEDSQSTARLLSDAQDDYWIHEPQLEPASPASSILGFPGIDEIISSAPPQTEPAFIQDIEKEGEGKAKGWSIEEDWGIGEEWAMLFGTIIIVGLIKLATAHRRTSEKSRYNQIVASEIELQTKTKG